MGVSVCVWVSHLEILIWQCKYGRVVCVWVNRVVCHHEGHICQYGGTTRRQVRHPSRDMGMGAPSDGRTRAVWKGSGSVLSEGLGLCEEKGPGLTMRSKWPSKKKLRWKQGSGLRER